MPATRAGSQQPSRRGRASPNDCGWSTSRREPNSPCVSSSGPAAKQSAFRSPAPVPTAPDDTVIVTERTFAVLPYPATASGLWQPLTPPLADAIVRKCLAKNAADRWRSAADLASALHWAVGDAKASAPSAPQTVWRRSHVVVALATLAAVALATGALSGWRYASSRTAPVVATIWA
jgi:hypothetical protein